MAEVSYKKLEQELNEIMRKIEVGDYEDLDQMLKDYAAGTKLVEQMQKKLDSAKNKINKVR